MKPCYPFSAIVGQDDFKLALALCLIDPGLGGVLAMGDKGTGKTTTVRALSKLMSPPGDYPFVNLPIGATEDRVLGSIKLEELINNKKVVVEKGLLTKAHRGILYVDEVNLLDDYLMDSLLDASAMDGYYLERDNISEWLPSCFVLVGTMNPEEGELRPQLLDRFGLSVHIKTPELAEERKQIVKSRLAFDDDNHSFVNNFDNEEATLRDKIICAQKSLSAIEIGEDVYEYTSQICAKKRIEGLRADILLIKTARAFAALNKNKKVTSEDVDRIKDFVLAHRNNLPDKSSNKSKPEWKR